MYEPKVRYKQNWVPFLSDEEIDTDVEFFIQDFNEDLLTNPQPIDVEKFAEIYLKLRPDYRFLTHCGLIWGRMVFNDTDKMPYYDDQKQRADYTSVERGMFMIDNTLLEPGNEIILKTTTAHECGHWIYHKPYFTEDQFQLSFIRDMSKVATACRKKDIVGGAGKQYRLTTDLEWIEHQAKYFSASLTMNRKAFLKVAEDKQLRDRIRKQSFGFAMDGVLANHIQDVFDVSYTSARIRIDKLGVSLDKEKNSFQRTIFPVSTKDDRMAAF